MIPNEHDNEHDFDKAIRLWAEAEKHVSRSGNIDTEMNRLPEDRICKLDTGELIALRTYHDGEARRLRAAARAAIGFEAP